jgi:aldose sugar dehydrogenase
VVAEGLSFPTSMEFVDDKDLLVLEKVKVSVRHILTLTNTSTKDEPVLKLSVDSKGERGLLGIAAMGNDNEGEGNSSRSATVFLYYTHGIPSRNTIIKYEWNGQKLVKPELILDLPAEPGPYHQGGKLKVETDKNKHVFLYAVIGDLTSPDTVLQNNKYGKEPNNTSIILKINLSENSTNLSSIFQYHNEVLSNNIPDSRNYNKSNTGSRNNESYGVENYSNNYQYSSFAYGIRNSFGLAVDPITGNYGIQKMVRMNTMKLT